jgi:autotransporter-associated beta strand protein
LYVEGGDVRVLGGPNLGALSNTVYLDGGNLVANNSFTIAAPIRVLSDSGIKLGGNTANVLNIVSNLTGDGVVTKGHQAQLRLSGNNSNFTGDWVVEQGTLIAGSINGLSDSTRVTVQSQGTLVVDTTYRFGSLEGDGAFYTDGDVRIGADNTDTTFSGSYSGGGYVRKIGSGKWTLDGNGSGFSGAVTVLDGTLAGSGSFAGLLVGAGGAVVAPGNSTGVFMANVVRLLPNSTLHIELGGTSVGEYDRLASATTVALEAELQVELVGGFSPAGGDRFDILTAGSSMTGTFAGLAEMDIAGSFGNVDLRVDYSASGASLVAFYQGDFNLDANMDCDDVNALVAMIASGNDDMPFDLTGDGVVDQSDLGQWLATAGEANLGPGQVYLPGDANLDGVVDGSDFNVWNANKFTQASAWCLGDFTADGVVDGSDFNVWNANKFRSSTAVVPEPATYAGCLIGGLLLWISRRRRDE